MSRCTRSIPRSPSDRGFSLPELLVALAVTTAAMAGAGAFFTTSVHFMRSQEREIETTQAVRASIDVMVRDLRLGGACLPVNGDFITLDGVNNGTTDEITTRTGLTRPDLSCVRSATVGITPMAGSTIAIERADGFQTNGRAYIRAADGTGEFFTVTSVDTGANIIGRDRAFTKDYAAASGVYAIDERRFALTTTTTPWGDVPQLILQIGDASPSPFALGIEQLNIQYHLRRNCPSCDVIDIPTTDDDWRLVDEVLLTLTGRSLKPNQDGGYYRRTMSVAIKPRNLLPD
jgi:prepilin-type N-terminal cleavage/methylation domain-containing protein